MVGLDDAEGVAFAPEFQLEPEFHDDDAPPEFQLEPPRGADGRAEGREGVLVRFFCVFCDGE